MPVVTVEPVESKAQLRRFADIPYVLHHRDERWSPGVRAFEQWRLDARRHPYFERGDAAYLLARRGGHPVGRIAAHVADVAEVRPGDGRFGFFDAADDPAVVDALLGAARAWLADLGATSMVGPISWTPEESCGVITRGADRGARTGLAWHPAWYARRLEAAGATVQHRIGWHELSTSEVDGAPPPPGGPTPPHAGAYADPDIVLDAAAAVPDVTALLAGASLRRAWRTARTARTRSFDTAVCVRVTEEPDVAVPALLRACRAAGYTTLVAPWAPDGHPVDQERSVYCLDS